MQSADLVEDEIFLREGGELVVGWGLCFSDQSLCFGEQMGPIAVPPE